MFGELFCIDAGDFGGYSMRKMSRRETRAQCVRIYSPAFIANNNGTYLTLYEYQQLLIFLGQQIIVVSVTPEYL